LSFASRGVSTKFLSSHIGTNYKNTIPLIALTTAGFVAIGVSQFQVEASGVDYSILKKEIADAIEEDSSKREDGTSMGPTLVRLAWHASGTFSAADKTGGSNGSTMRMEPECKWGANAGLQIARDFLEPFKARYPSVSYADLWTLAGAVAIESSGGPAIPWRSGRSDSAKPTAVPDGRLPSADSNSIVNDINHIRAVFGRMGFNDKEMVALIGAHALGRCHTNASGYWGPWTRAETTFSNEYFRLLLEERWTVKTKHLGQKWTGPTQYESKDGTLMMLPTDLALLYDASFSSIVESFAKDEALFFKEFSAAFSKLLELGVPFPSPPKTGLFGWGFLGL